MIEWLKQEWFTLISILVSGLISWILSAVYFYKGNRSNLEMTILFPVLKITSKRLTRERYIELKELSQNYLTRFLSETEMTKLTSLVEAYRFVSGYDEAIANATAVLSDFEERLKKNNINPKIVPVYIDGEIVDYEYPEDINYIHVRIEKVFSENYLEIDGDICRKQIVRILSSFAKEYYTDVPNSLFVDYNLENIIRNAAITDKWNRKFDKYEKAKHEFEDLKIIKKLMNKTSSI